MSMDALSLDQFAIFITIVDEGSFTAAAKKLNRSQSAITYAVQKLEEQSGGVALFDRTAYRPVLTEAGRALLPRAKKIIEDLEGYRSQARAITEGLEAEVRLVLDGMAPSPLVAEALKDFNAIFPQVRVRISIELFSTALRLLSDGGAHIGVVVEGAAYSGDFECHSFFSSELVAVAAPSHPLANLSGAISPEQLRDHVQLVVDVRAPSGDRKEYGVLSVNRWYLTDMETKHIFLMSGLGWGSMPRHRVANDIQDGRLVELPLLRWEVTDRMPELRFVVAHRRAEPLGPAGRWLLDRLIVRSA